MSGNYCLGYIIVFESLGGFTMPHLSQACLLGYTPLPQHTFKGDAARHSVWPG